MIWQFNVYALPLLLGVVPVLGLALAAWQHRSVLAARYFLLFALAVAGFMLTYGLELLSATLPLMMVWLRLEYIFSVSLPVFWLLFFLNYSGHDAYLTRPRIALLFIIPAIHLLAVWTNDWHGLNWQHVGTTLLGSLVVFERTYGPVFWIGTGYLYLVTLSATIIMAVSVMRWPELYRGQIISLILATISMWGGHILTVIRVTPLDLTPFGGALASVFIAWSLFHHKLFDILPAAKGTVFRSMSDAVFVLNMQDTVLDLNPAAEQLSSTSAKKAIGQPLQALFPRSVELIQRFRSVYDGQQELEIRQDGAKRYFDLRISPLYDRRGQLTGRVAVLRDVTRFKQAEETVRRYAAELEERNNELDAFSHSVAHDLKNPLASIQGYAELLDIVESEHLSDKSRKYIQVIKQSSQKMVEMTDELLRLSKLRDLDKAVVEVDVNPVVRSALQRFQQDIQQRGIAIDIMPDMPPALGQPLWIEEIFANLLSNAIKYIGKDNAAPCIQISAVQQNGCVQYRVQDNGLGIDPNDQAKVFRVFARFHEKEASGLGLGLSIFLRIVRRLGGQVGVESAPGAGSIFWFTLPAPGKTP